MRNETTRQSLTAPTRAPCAMGHGWHASASPGSAPVGEVGGRYVIQGTLGRGGMCEVYRAYDSILERHVALKFVRATELAGHAQERILREARVVSSLEHPNVVPLLDVGVHERAVYLALELCDGGNMRLRVGDPDVPFADRVRWLRQIAEALAYAHASGMVHRDVKPENIVLTGGGVAKLTDFGIAKALAADGPALTHGIIGTPRYMAPEQLAGEPVDGRVDQFAWALVAVELLTGDGLGAADERHEGALEDKGVPRALAPVLARCLQARVGLRYPDMGAVLAELDAAPFPSGARARVPPQDADERAALREFKRVLSMGAVRLGLPIHLLFWGVDILLLPTLKWPLLGLRILCALLCVATNAALMRAHRLAAAQRVGAGYAAAMSLLGTATMHLIGDLSTPYFTGIHLVAVTTLAFVPWTHAYRCAVACVFYLPILALIAVEPRIVTSWTSVSTNFAFAIAAVAISLVARYEPTKARPAR